MPTEHAIHKENDIVLECTQRNREVEFDIQEMI